MTWLYDGEQNIDELREACLLAATVPRSHSWLQSLQTSTLLPAETAEPVNMLEKWFLSLNVFRYIHQDSPMGTVVMKACNARKVPTKQLFCSDDQSEIHQTIRFKSLLRGWTNDVPTSHLKFTVDCDEGVVLLRGRRAAHVMCYQLQHVTYVMWCILLLKYSYLFQQLLCSSQCSCIQSPARQCVTTCFSFN